MTNHEQPTKVVFSGIELLDRMERAVLLVAERQRRSTAALASAGIPFAVSGSNATAIWIATTDPAGVRQARNVELILPRQDFQPATTVLQSAGFVLCIKDNQHRFLDGPDGKWRDAVEITFGGEAIVGKAPDRMAPLPDESEVVDGWTVPRLHALVEFQLARFRRDDAVDLRDMIDVGLIDSTWPQTFQPELAARLQELLDDPDG